VYSTAIVNGEIIVAGAFTQACAPGPASTGYCNSTGRLTRDDIFAFQPGTGQIDPNFDPVLNAGPVYSLAAGPAGSNTVYVGGSFTTVNGVSHKGIVQLNVNPGVTTGSTADGSVVTGFKASLAAYADALALSPSGDALYVGGQFSSADSTTESGIVRLNASTGAVDTSFHFTLSDPENGAAIKVEDMALSPDGTHLVIAGTPLEVNGVSDPRLALIDTGETAGGPTLGKTATLANFTAPILANNCSAEHDYVRGVDFSPDGSYFVVADTGYLSAGGPSLCDAMARFDVNSADSASTGTQVQVSPAWVNFGGGDSFYAVQVTGTAVYAGGHNRWVNNYCGNNNVCEPNAVLADGIAALDPNTGLALPYWHPGTTRGHGVLDLYAFGAGAFSGSLGGLLLGTDPDSIGGTYHAELALFPLNSTAAATPGGPIPSGTYVEDGGTNTGTPLCVDDPGNSAVSGTAVEQVTCANDAEQNWTAPSNGTIQINGLCIDTSGDGTAVGTPVVLGSCSDTTSKWTQQAGNTLVNTASGLCLDNDSLTTSGSQLEISTCSGGSNQVWPLPAAPAPPAPPATGTVFSNLTQSDTDAACMTNNNNDLANGNPIVMYQCANSIQQNWTIETSGTVQVQDGYCMDTSGGGTTSGTPVVLEKCNGDATQVWVPGSYASNFQLVNKASGLCLDDPNLNPANGVQLQLWSCNGGNNQAWRLPTV
jgi:hypothetical protein